MKSEPAADICVTWSETMRRYHTTSCALENALQADHDLGLSEFEVLAILARNSRNGEEKVRMKDLEAEMYLSQSALSRTVSRLERAGLVERAACETDRRANFLTLTAAGRERHDAAAPTHRSVLIEHLD